jgi:hypothetical protein
MASSFGDNKEMRKKYICSKSQACKRCSDEAEEENVTGAAIKSLQI